MEILKKQSVALICMILVIVGITFLQARNDMIQVVHETENLFLIDEGDGFSIQSKLESKMEFASELANKFAIRFLNTDSIEIISVNIAIDGLRSAPSIEAKYDASAMLDQACSQLMGVLEKQAMDSDSERELRRFYSNLQNCTDQISHSLYNEKAMKVHEEMSGFPAGLFQKIFGIELPQLYK